jgi:hypothetical protein
MAILGPSYGFAKIAFPALGSMSQIAVSAFPVSIAPFSIAIGEMSTKN